MNKTLIFLDWLGKYKKAFLSNQNSKPLPAISNYIDNSFVWSETPEGHAFWQRLNELWKLELKKKNYSKVLYEEPVNKLAWLK